MRLVAEKACLMAAVMDEQRVVKTVVKTVEGKVVLLVV